MKTHVRNRMMWVAALGLCAAGANTLRAVPITADFDGGNTNTEVDAWRGMAGEGWTAAWGSGSQARENCYFDVTVMDDNPLQAGTGNYLFMDYGNARSSGRGAYVSRVFDLDAVLEVSPIIEVEFLFRLDTPPERLRRAFFTANTGGSQIDMTPSYENAWGFSSLPETSATPTFRFIDDIVGEAYGYDDSEVTLYQGDVYQFHFTVNYAAQTYTAGVINLSFEENERTGTSEYTSDTLTFGFKPDEENPANSLSWSLRDRGQENPSISQASIDAIRIIPEPGAGLLLLGALGLLLVRRQR